MQISPFAKYPQSPSMGATVRNDDAMRPPWMTSRRLSPPTNGSHAQRVFGFGPASQARGFPSSASDTAPSGAFESVISERTSSRPLRFS